MDEKESITENPNEAVSEASGDHSAADKPTTQDHADKQVAETSETVDNANSDSNKDSESVTTNDTGSVNSKLQNHVDHDINIEDCAKDSEIGKDSGGGKENVESMDVESQEGMKEGELKSDEIESEDIQDKLKEESVVEDTPEENSQEESVTRESQGVTQASDDTSLDGTPHESEDVATKSKDTSSETPESQIIPSQEDNEEKADEDQEDKKDDEVGKPEFETAPNVSLDESQEDHTQALDPFDALLKDRSDPTADSSSTSRPETSVNVDDDDDDHNADNGDGEIGRDEDEDVQHPELVDQPGADEEVCLLPDTEREISEADKAEAEKVLAEKRKQAEAAASAVEAAVPKRENETSDTQGDEPMNSDDIGEQMDTDIAGEDVSQENGGGDKENEVDDTAEIEENLVPNTIQEISPADNTCVQCKSEQPCSYRFVTKDGENQYICTADCVKTYQADHPGQYTVATKKYLIEEISPKQLTCSECEEKKACFFYYNYDGEDTNYCSLKCLHSMMADEKDKYVFKRRRIMVEEITPKEGECIVCKETKRCSYEMSRYGEIIMVCEQTCIKTLNDDENGRYIVKKKRVPRKAAAQANPPLLKLKVISNATDKYLDEAYKIQAKTPAMVQAAREERERTFIRRCTQCYLILDIDDKMLTWETMDFCNEVCLGRYQNKIGARCANCKNNVQHTSLGKYCVRFGYDIRQFCNSGCLEEFKKRIKDMLLLSERHLSRTSRFPCTCRR